MMARTCVQNDEGGTGVGAKVAGQRKVTLKSDPPVGRLKREGGKQRLLELCVISRRLRMRRAHAPLERARAVRAIPQAHLIVR